MEPNTPPTSVKAPRRVQKAITPNLSPAETLVSSSSETVGCEEVQTDMHLASCARQTSKKNEPSLNVAVTAMNAVERYPAYEVDWESSKDPANPKNFSPKYRYLAASGLSWNTFVVMLYSTTYTPSISILTEQLHVSKTIATLGLTIYLLGLAAGSPLMATLTEVYGRRFVSIICMFLFAMMVLPCALTHSMVTLLVFRFLAGFFGSVMVSASPGMVSDVATEKSRSLCFSIWGLGPLNAPVVGPIIGGFVTQYKSWETTNWVVFGFAMSTFLVCLFMKESYAPILLQQKAARLRKQTGDDKWWSRYDTKDGSSTLLKQNIKRPFVMAATEPICIFWNLYVGILYGILFLCFTAYPIVFGQMRGWSVGMSGLAYSGIGLGSLITMACEPLIRKLIARHRLDPRTNAPPPESLVSIICICSILIPIGELWFAWTCVPVTIHWIVPILAGVPFGAGNTGVFIYASGYLTKTYGVYAASAMAGNAMIRTLLGGITPFVGTFMYAGIGPNWSATLLGLIEVALIPIPFIFYKYGYRIRQKSEMVAKEEVVVVVEERSGEAEMSDGPQEPATKIHEV